MFARPEVGPSLCVLLFPLSSRVILVLQDTVCSPLPARSETPFCSGCPTSGANSVERVFSRSNTDPSRLRCPSGRGLESSPLFSLFPLELELPAMISRGNFATILPLVDPMMYFVEFSLPSGILFVPSPYFAFSLLVLFFFESRAPARFPHRFLGPPS